MKNFALAAMLMVLSSFAFGQSYTTVTAPNVTVDNGSGTAVNPPSGSSLCFLGVNNTGAAITYTPSGGSPISGPVCQTLDGSGNLTGSLQVANQATASPVGLRYTITVVDGGTTYLTIPIVQFSGALFQFNTFALPGNGRAGGIGYPHLACNAGAAWSSTTLPSGHDASVCTMISGVGSWVSYPQAPYCAANMAYQTPQISGAPFCLAPVESGNGAPTGACTKTSFYFQQDAPGTIYGCYSGSWSIISGSGSSGITSFQGRTTPGATLQAADLSSVMANSPFGLTGSTSLLLDGASGTPQPTSSWKVDSGNLTGTGTFFLNNGSANTVSINPATGATTLANGNFTTSSSGATAWGGGASIASSGVLCLTDGTNCPSGVTPQYQTMQNSTVSLTPRSKLNFINSSGVVGTDNSGNGSTDISLAAIPNSALANNSVTVNVTGGATGGGTIALGGSTTINVTGSGAVGPQYAISGFTGSGSGSSYALGQTNSYTDSTGNNLTVPGALTGKITNGGLNSDMYATGSGNNGIANALASCGSPCTVNVPATSTDTETPYTINTSGNHIFDQRGQSNGDFFYNPAVGGGAGYNPGGQPHSGAEEIYGKWDIPTQAPDFTQTQIGQSLNLSFNSPGWNFGTDTGYTGPLWADTNGLNISMTGSTPGIAGMITGINTTYHVGDSQAFALYTQPDGGWTDGAGEGSSGGILHRDQNTTWFHGTVNSGATHGTQLLQTTYVPGALSRPQASVGGYMLDISRLVGQFTVTGAATQVGSLSVFATPVTPSVTESTAWGSPNTDIPGPTNPEGTQTDTVTFTVLGGTNSGGYTTGVACLAGQQFFEQVLITAVGAISGGQQSVTFTHGYPNTHAGSSMWQGGICGDYYVPTLKYLNGWDAAYPIVGATDSSHVVGRLFAGETTKWPLPSPWGATTVNVPLVGLSISGTTVTATINSPSPAVFANVTGAVVSGATNSSFNGTTGSITVVNNNQLQWTQTGPTGTSASALLTLPSNNFVFYMIPGAPVTQPCTSAGCPLQPNNVAWTAGDNVENPFNPSFRGYGLTVESIVNSPSAAIIGGSGSLSLEDKGLGVGGGYSVFSWTNSSPLSQYVGAGGTLTAPTGILFSGALGPLLTSQYAPLDPGIASINIGCAIPSQGGCSSTNDIRWMSIGNTINGVAAFTASDFFDFSKLSAHTILRSRIASTGLGLRGDNPVALTSSNSVINDDVMGTYGAFGNETLLDTSALVGAKTFYAGLLHAGALAPTMNGVFVNGTPGSSTWSYTAKSVTQFGESLPATVATTNTGNATLDPTNNFNGLNITPGYGAQSTNVYRTAAPAGYSVGLICANVPNNVINGTSSGFGCKDSGQATLGPLTADVDNSGQVTSAAASFGTVTAASYSSSGSANGNIGLTASGTPPSSAPANTIQLEAPNSVTAYRLELPPAQPSASGQFITCTNANPSVCTFANLGSGTTATLTAGTGVTSVTCASATCTNQRGTMTIVGGTATTGTIASLSWTATSAAYVCSATLNGGTAFLGIGNSVATTTGVNITSGVSVAGLTITVNYSCQP